MRDFKDWGCFLQKIHKFRGHSAKLCKEDKFAFCLEVLLHIPPKGHSVRLKGNTPKPDERRCYWKQYCITGTQWQNTMDVENLEGLKKEKKIGKVTYDFKIWAQKYKLDKLFYCCSDFLPLLLKQLVLFSARHKSMNKMIHDSFVFIRKALWNQSLDSRSRVSLASISLREYITSGTFGLSLFFYSSCLSFWQRVSEIYLSTITTTGWKYIPNHVRKIWYQ